MFNQLIIKIRNTGSETSSGQRHDRKQKHYSNQKTRTAPVLAADISSRIHTLLQDFLHYRILFYLYIVRAEGRSRQVFVVVEIAVIAGHGIGKSP